MEDRIGGFKQCVRGHKKYAFSPAALEFPVPSHGVFCEVFIFLPQKAGTGISEGPWIRAGQVLFQGRAVKKSSFSDCQSAPLFLYPAAALRQCRKIS